MTLVQSIDEVRETAKKVVSNYEDIVSQLEKILEQERTKRKEN
jgi:hypothetical protein